MPQNYTLKVVKMVPFMSHISYHNKTEKGRKPKCTPAQLLLDKDFAGRLSQSHAISPTTECVWAMITTTNVQPYTTRNVQTLLHLLPPQDREEPALASSKGPCPHLRRILSPGPPSASVLSQSWTLLAASLFPAFAPNPVRTEGCLHPSPPLPPHAKQFSTLHTSSFHQYKANSGRRKVHDSYNLLFMVKFSLRWPKGFVMRIHNIEMT